MPKISEIKCHKVLNSRGDWTIETHVLLDDGSEGVEAVPDGASKGEHEAVYVDVHKAIDIVEHPLNDLLVGDDPFDQKNIDQQMLDMDGTKNKRHLGGNSILSVSLAVAKACAVSKNVELYTYLAQLADVKLTSPLKFPTPVFNIINGGKHANNGLSFQEFMVIPAQSWSIAQAIEIGVDIYHTLEEELKANKLDIDVGDEGGFAPNGLTVKKALNLLKTAVEKKYKGGKDVFFGMDVAAESFYKSRKYHISEEDLELSADELATFYGQLLQKFELIYLEDPFYENDIDGWRLFMSKYGKKLMVVADDLVVTNSKFLTRAVDEQLANAVIVKPNQVGTLTETFDFIQKAKVAGMAVVVSHRSGDTAEDTFIADLAVAVEADFIKSGAPARGERVAKYNRLLEIFDDLS